MATTAMPPVLLVQSTNPISAAALPQGDAVLPMLTSPVPGPRGKVVVVVLVVTVVVV
jgi:hypothetical protein